MLYIEKNNKICEIKFIRLVLHRQHIEKNGRLKKMSISIFDKEEKEKSWLRITSTLLDDDEE